MKPPIPLILKQADWPEADRACWDSLFTKADFFDAGPLVHLRPTSVDKLRQTYGHWLSFLLRNGRLLEVPRAYHRATVENIAAFIDEGEIRLSKRTIYGFLRDLHWLFTSMAPDQDWDWLERAYLKLGANSNLWGLKPRKATKAQEIYCWAMHRMASVEKRPGPIAVAQAVDFRDGLMLAFLISVPLRVRTLMGLRLDRHIAFDGAQFSVQLEPDDVKDRKAHEYSLGPDLTYPMQVYINTYRSVLLGKAPPSGYLWISGRGAALGIDSFTKHLAQLTQREFGEVLRPHAFREIAATSIAFEAPEMANIIADLLGHSSLTMSEKHYNRASGVKAATLHQGVIAKLRRKAEREGQ